MGNRSYLGTLILSVVLLLASGVSGLAKNSRTVTLRHDAAVGGKTLPAGQYVIRWETQSPQASVEFVRGKEVVLSTEGRFEKRDRKYPNDMVVYDTASDGSLTVSEIRFGGSSEVLVFKQ